MYTENEIIDGCIKKNRNMQKILYDKYASKFYVICLRYVYDKAEADDILQDGFLKIFTNIGQFSREHSLEGWMRRVIVNTAITHYKKNQKHYFQKELEDINETDIENFNVLDAEFTQDELLQTIQRLAEGYKMIFNLYAIEGYKHKEIAEMLNIDEATSKSQFHRARKIIQEKLTKLAKTRTIKG
jgi:RNA polymerase sigma factor (sigma-70 family)